MSTTQLAVAPQDISAASLGVRLDGPAPTVLVGTTLQGSGACFRLDLGILGASHVVDATLLDGGQPSAHLREEISCHAMEGGMALGDGVEKKQRWVTGTYRLRARTVQLGTEEFAERAETILQAAEAESWLVGKFPGEGNHHLTALWGEVEGGTARWKTWHFYPAELTVVESESELTTEVRA